MKIIGLDIGTKRIGVAKADSKTRIAVPVGFVTVDGSEWQEIAHIANLNNTNLFVLGLPRSNEGNETKQSMYVRQFAKSLLEKMPGARVRFQDESLTSVVAEERLKARKKPYQKGDIDAESAAIILQDFLESFQKEKAVDDKLESALSEVLPDNSPKAQLKNIQETTKHLAKKETDKVKLNSKKAKNKAKSIFGLVVLPIVLLLGAGLIGGLVWFNNSLSPVDSTCANTSTCSETVFSVEEGEPKVTIAANLEKAGLIKNSFVFKTYLQLFKPNVDFKAGNYKLNAGFSADEIIDRLAKGVDNENTFSFTILPGETIYDVKKKLLNLNYSEAEINAALTADYDFDFLQGRPAGATLEGYLYGETYNFYETDSVRTVFSKFLEGMGKVITENNLEERYKNQGLSLFEGITLASIVQKESPAGEHAKVAQVFLSRMELGWKLGSDVTVSYALDTVDPERRVYSDNAAALNIDSCYNTRLYTGLPCGPISNPGLASLLAVAEPADTSNLYFLTGDDGVMYYSTTESEHNQKASLYCQQLCNISL